MNFPSLPVFTAALACLSLTSCEKQAPQTNPSGAAVRVNAPASGWSIAALPQRWALRGFQEDKDLSGIAAWDGTHCLVCSDELRVIQAGRMDRNGGTIIAGAAVPLLPGQSGKTELDAEGV